MIWDCFYLGRSWIYNRELHTRYTEKEKPSAPFQNGTDGIFIIPQ